MTEPSARLLTLAAIGGLVAVGIATAAAGACSPGAQRVAAPLVAISPAACALLPEGSAERDVCDASAALARSLERLSAERASGAPCPVASAEEVPSAAPAGSD